MDYAIEPQKFSYATKVFSYGLAKTGRRPAAPQTEFQSRPPPPCQVPGKRLSAAGERPMAPRPSMLVPRHHMCLLAASAWPPFKAIHGGPLRGSVVVSVGL